MMRSSLLFVVALVLALPACGRKDASAPSAEQAKAEKAAATKAVRDNPVYGDQFKAMDKAKASAEDATRKTEDNLKKAEEAK